MSVAATKREERSRRFGVDCPDALTWAHWTPGGEYIRKLILKNTHERLQVLRYNLPVQKATFFVEFPTPVTLSSGMHYELVIRFRPTVLADLDDSIEIVVEGRGSFHVGLVAKIPFARVSVPEKHDFGFCPVTATTSATVTVSNTGTVPLELEWELQPPFTMEPRTQSVAEGDSTVVKVSFVPSEAIAVVAKAVCRQAGAESGSALAVLNLSGIGKYAYLRCNGDGGESGLQSKIDFGTVLTGRTKTKSVTLQNRSMVPAAFSLKRTDNDFVCPFTFSPTSGVVMPEGSQAIEIKYKPESTTATYSSTFALTTIGGNAIPFHCFGAASGPSVTISAKSLDFGDVDLEKLPQPSSSSLAPTTSGASATGGNSKYVTVKNTSDVEVAFQFVGCEPGNAFAVTPAAGTLGPNKHQNVCVEFRPNAPLNYLRRVHILVKHSDKAAHIDLLGTAFNSRLRPAPFSIKEVRYYFLRLQYGLGRITPDEIEKLLAGNKSADVDLDGTLSAAAGGTKAEDDGDEDAARQALLAAIEDSQLDASSTDRLLRSVECGGARDARPKLPRGMEPLANVLPADDRLQLPYTLEEPVVRFRHNALGEVKTVVVRNHTSTKATANWVLPENCPWNLTPLSADIPAFGFSSFRLHVQLQQPGGGSTATGGTFGHYLECFVNHKAMRSFRLVNPATFTPSQCLTLHCSCVQPVSETSATPQARVPSHIAFPACHLDDCAFQVIPVTNLNDTVASFDISIDAKIWRGKQAREQAAHEPHYDDDFDDPAQAEELALATKSVFMCYPPSGTIPPHGTSLVLFRFVPNRLARYRGVAVVSFNESAVGARTVYLRGQGFVPAVTLTQGGLLTIRPTAVGGETSRTYTIANPSRIPVRYTAQVPERFAGVLQLSPREAVIPGYSEAAVLATFTPTRQRRYEIDVPIAVQADKPPKGHEGEVSTQVCRVTGEGMVGVVALEPHKVDLGTAMVGTATRETLTIFNSGLCDVRFRLGFVPVATADGTEPDENTPKLTFSPSDTGVLRARSHVNVAVSVTLPDRGRHAYDVYVLSHGSKAAVDETVPSTEDIARLPNCRVTVAGGHPTLQVTDIRSVFQRKSQLWRQMSIVKFNQILSLPVAEHDTETRSYTFEGACANLDPIVCDLGVDTYRTAPIRILMRLDNAGHCPVGFRFWLPHESDVPKEPWHQDPLSGPDQQLQAEIIDNNLFDVQPRQSTIPAGGHVIVQFTYAHSRIGQHGLPVMLKIDRGKRLLLKLTARTLSESARYLALHHSMQHELLPVAIGDLEPPLQYTELQNLSHHPITYVVDNEALAEVREKSYDFPVFQCLNPQGIIPPMSTLLLSWYFRPIEARQYQVKVPIAVQQGDTYTLTLSGEGYHPKKVTSREIQRMHENEAFPLPAVPTLRHESLPLRLSLDVMRFGAVPQHTLHRRMIELHNAHPTDTFLFEWHSTLQYGDQLLDVDPPRGRIRPGESIRMRISLYTGSTSHVIDNPIHCHVLNEDLRARRLARREAVEHEAAMNLDGPTGVTTTAVPGTTAGLSTTGGTLALAARDARKKESAAAAAKARLPITTIPAKFQSTARLKKSIEALTEAAAAEELDDNDEEQTYVDVLPTVLEVLVQTRIMSLDAYTAVYGDVAAHHYHFPTFKAYATPVGPEEMNALQPFQEDELHIARDVLDEMLQRLVHHRTVADAYADVTEDAVPYFCQIRAEAGGKEPVVVNSNQNVVHVTPPEGEEEELHSRGLGASSGYNNKLEPEAEQRNSAPPPAPAAAAAADTIEDVSADPASPVALADVARDADLEDGELHCLVEEALEGMLFGLLTEDTNLKAALQPSAKQSSATLRHSVNGSRRRTTGPYRGGSSTVVGL